MRVIDNIQDFDRRTLLLSQQSRSWIAAHCRLVSHTADGYYYVLIGALWALFSGETQRVVVLLGTAFAVERGVYWVLKNSLRRKRPSQALPGFESQINAADEFSFPSGHSCAAFLFATLVMLELGPITAPLYLWSAGVAMSRVYLGVHFPTDTVMGAALGTGIAMSVALTLA